MSVKEAKEGKTSLTNSVVQFLLGKILSGEWTAGDHLPPERELAAQLGMSRSSVHLAISELTRKGFLESIPRQGTIVCDYRRCPTPDSLQMLMSYGSVELGRELFSDMMETRLLLETEAARLACAHIDENRLGDMQQLLLLLSEPGADAADLLYRFHYNLIQASGNSIYSMIFRGFEPVIRNLIALHYTDKADLPQSVRRHQVLLDAVRAGDAARAARLANEIVAQGIAAIESNYSRTSSPPGKDDRNLLLDGTPVLANPI